MKRVILLLLVAASGAWAEMPDMAPLLGEDWYGVYFNGQKAGYAREAFEKRSDGQYNVEQDAHFQMSMAGVRQDMHINTRRLYDAEGKLASVESVIETPSEKSRFVGVVEGDIMKFSRFLGGEESVSELPRPAETLEDSVKHALWVLKSPVVGDGMNFSLFEPMYSKEVTGVSFVQAIEERILNGVPTPVYKIQSNIDVMGLSTVTYVTARGVVLEDHIADNMVLRLEPAEVAKQVDYSNDVIVSNAAILDAPLQDPRGRDSLSLKITAPLGEDHLFNDNRQNFSPAEGFFNFTSKRIDLKGFTAATLPVTDPAYAQWVEASAYVQSDNDAVKAKAAEIIDGETNAVKAAEKLCSWVYTNMKSTFSARLTNTLEVLNHLEGDCTEHSVLFVGLARAAGIPAQTVAGLIYVEASQPGFYFHQWSRVWVGEWIEVDPTFNQVGVDVTHIKLSEGDLLEQTKLLPLIGQIKVEVNGTE
ncbi:MAG: hypothetical protein GC168_16655 [Candidatus Hydrogenedens sp.]|nr:hypothetical protein [Candidatus Hydrogenedens sp.]